MMEKVKFGIIGFGNMGSNHANSFIENKITNGMLTAVADNDIKKIESAKQKLGGNITYFNSADELISSGLTDAVIVATPHYSHCGISINALNRGLNVICEKPAGVYTKQVEEMNNAAAKAKGLFTVMFCLRANSLYKKVSEIVSGGGVGEIKRVNWLITDWYRPQSYYNSSTWRATWKGEGGGVLLNQCPHQIDLLIWITGMVPKKVRAFCRFGKWHDIEVEDDVTAYFEYENGASGVFVTSTADSPGTNRLEILGTKGKVVCEKGQITYYKLKQDEREFNKEFKGFMGEPAYDIIPVEHDGKNPLHAAIINNFANAVKGAEPLFIDGREGYKSVQLLNAMLLSSWLDKTVKIPFDDDLYLSMLEERIRRSEKTN
ncbi:MAG: Gfo/Idh/MocA family oxidoreductase [Clostridia bacterium]|nr:Gfo/Idh/MocA family oxidoreductase [Clostridia bacterium]